MAGRSRSSRGSRRARGSSSMPARGRRRRAPRSRATRGAAETLMRRGAIAFTQRSWETLGLSVRNIGRTKLRSSLTILGVVLGVASVIVMLAVGEGARLAAIEQIRGLGAENIIIRSVKPLTGPENSEGGLIEYGLTADDLDRIATTIPTV